MSTNSDDASTPINFDLEFARAEIHAAFDRWFYWQNRLRDLVNAADHYTCDAYDVSATTIKQAMRHGLLDTMSKIYRFECLRERLEGISNSGSPEERQ